MVLSQKYIKLHLPFISYLWLFCYLIIMMPGVRRPDVCAGNHSLDGSETEPVNSLCPHTLFNSVTWKQPFFLHPSKIVSWFLSKGLFVCVFNLGVDKMISFHVTWQLILGLYLLYRKLYFTLQICRLPWRKYLLQGLCTTVLNAIHHIVTCFIQTWENYRVQEFGFLYYPWWFPPLLTPLGIQYPVFGQRSL